jgi:hypothetical protein
MIGSAFLGDGVPVFTGPRTGLRLVEVRRLGDSQLILARYATDWGRAGDEPPNAASSSVP